MTRRDMTMPAMRRAPGAPSSALPALAGFAFVSLLAPIFYGAFIAIDLIGGAPSDAQFNNLVSYGLGGGLVWLLATVFLVFYPATRGKIWALKILRFMAVGGIAALLAALVGDFVFYFKQPAGQSGFAVFLFWFPLAPLMVAAGFLADGLSHQPWFDPNATAEEIGPSRGTAADLNRRAGLDAQGLLPPETLEKTLAASAPAPRWLCYAAPPIAAMRMKAWWQAAIFTPLCIAAILLVPFIPIRAIFIYGLMGTFADRLRTLATFRMAIAQAQGATKPVTHKRKPPA